MTMKNKLPKSDLETLLDLENQSEKKIDNPASSSHPSSLDDLLDDPFDRLDANPSQPFQAALEEATFKVKKQVTNDRLIDQLPDHRQSQARDLASKIDEEDMGAILAYGAKAQKKLGDFSHQILNHVQVKDTGEVGQSLVDLMTQLKETHPDDLIDKPTLLQRVFKKAKNTITETQIKYQKVSSQIDRIALKLERERNDLLNDNRMLDQFYQRNKEYYEALNIYIAAGEVKMDQLINERIPAAIDLAKSSQNQMDIQKVNDLSQFLDRLDKRTHDLRLTRQMTLQQAPQIRMIQNTNQALAEKIQASLHTAIPLWENQITIALALLRQENAAQSQAKVSQTTNDLLLRNSQMLHQGSTEVAREVERGVIDLDTLKQSQTNLIKTIEDTMEIQEAGYAQRRAAEAELHALEEELRNKLLEISHSNKQKQ